MTFKEFPKFENKPEAKEDYFFFNRTEFPSELNEAINLEVQKQIEGGSKFLVVPQFLYFEDEEHAKDFSRDSGTYYDISTEEGKEAIISAIEGKHTSSWPPGIYDRFRELLKEKNDEDQNK
ncbi:MAG: hypothetical protein PHO28_03020 [Candidatus Pacebacteria bacterium]|nr:hypothetical protein [Candidatus Paceibacterota bacterium]